MKLPALAAGCMTFFAAAILISSCAPSPVPPAQVPYRAAATTDELMRGLVGPLSDVIFESAVYVNGVPEGGPQTEEDWELVVDSALGLAETGNLLVLDGHAKGREDWIGFSDDLIDAGVFAANAALTRDIDTMLDAGSEVWEVCLACHEQYVPED